MWYETFDSVFWITTATLLTGFFGLVIRYCLKSKCENVSCCWGCLTVIRNTELEQDEELGNIETTRATQAQI